MKKDLSIFRYSTMLTLTRAGITTFEELQQLTNDQIAAIHGMGLRSYAEILEKLGRKDELAGRVQRQL